MHTFYRIVFLLFITLVSTQVSLAEPVKSEMTFEKVKELHLEDFIGNVHIKDSNSDDGKVHISVSENENSDKVAKDWDISNSDGILTFKDKRVPKNKSINISFVELSKLIFVNGLSLEKIQKEDLPHVKITLPKNTPLNISLLAGELKIDDTEAPLSLTLKGAAKSKIKKSTGNIQLHITGVGGIFADELKGDKLKATISGAGSLSVSKATFNSVDLNVKGTGGITLKDGEIINALNAVVSGVGSCELNVKAKDASLVVKGIGNIYLQEATGKVSRAVKGIGKIKVGKEG